MEKKADKRQKKKAVVENKLKASATQIAETISIKYSKPAVSKTKPVAVAIALHKAFLDALGEKYAEKKTDGFYTITNEEGKKVAYLRDANHAYLSIASRYLGDLKARKVRTESDVLALVKQITTQMNKKEVQ